MSKPFVYIELASAVERQTISLVISDIDFAAGSSAPSSCLYFPVTASLGDTTAHSNATQVGDLAQLDFRFQASVWQSEEVASSHDGPFDTRSPAVAAQTSRKWATHMSALTESYG